MSARARLWLFLIGGAGSAALLIWGMAGLPRFGHYPGPYGLVLNGSAVAERHATNVPSAVVFDYRGFDTVGEEFILLAAVMGVTLLLRMQRDEREEPPQDEEDGRPGHRTSDAVRVAALLLIAPTVVLGIYVVVHGQVTPGGGFQGGLILGGAPLLVYLAGRYLTFRVVSPTGLLDFAEGSGAGGFVVVGLAGMIAGTAYLQNVFPLGQPGSVFSGGTLPVINLSVGLEVAAGVVLILYEFLEQTLMVRRRA